MFDYRIWREGEVDFELDGEVRHFLPSRYYNSLNRPFPSMAVFFVTNLGIPLAEAQEVLAKLDEEWGSREF